MRGKRDNDAPQREGGQQSWAKHGRDTCPLCGGVIASDSWREKARRGGVKSFLISLQPGRLSMRDRGKYGGRPRALKIEDIERREAAPGPTPYVLGAPPPHYDTE